jgi:ribosomal protein L29
MSEKQDITPETKLNTKDEQLTSLKAVAEFYKGMAKFRQQVKAPSKNGHVDFQTRGGRKKYDYVLLDDLIKAIDNGIKDTGLAWNQEVETVNGGIKVRTLIMSESGYQYTSPWLGLQSAANPQDVGSAITYARRYSLGTTFGINSEPDDDANEVGEPKKQPAKPQAQPTSNTTKQAPKKPTKSLLQKQLDELTDKVQKSAKIMTMEPKELMKRIAEKADVKNPRKITKQDITAMLRELKTEYMEYQSQAQKEANETSDEAFANLGV